jgi:hypothetical protein
MAKLNKGKDNLKDRKFDKKIFDISDSKDPKFVSSDDQNFMSASFAKGDHIQDSNTYYITAPLMFQLNQMQEEIDELRSFISTELATTSSMEPVSASFATVSQSIFSANKNALQSKINTNETGLTLANASLTSLKTFTGSLSLANINTAGLPLSSKNLKSGQLYNDKGIIKIV